MNTPKISSTFVVSDSPKLAAKISCRLAEPGVYLPVVDGPRLDRPDAASEVVRRNNAGARAGAKAFLLAGLSDRAVSAFRDRFPSYRFSVVSSDSDLEKLPSRNADSTAAVVAWARDRIGVGLLKALRARSTIVFSDEPSPIEVVPSDSGHFVVCEEGEELSEVVAANYAFALGAGLGLIPPVPKQISKTLLQDLYDLHDRDTGSSATERLQEIKSQLLSLCGDVPIPREGSITFICRELPFGFAFPEVPSTHLFSYPDLGIAVVNGLSAEQAGTRGVNVAILIDPETTAAPEINAAAQALAQRDTFVRVYRGRGANVASVENAIEHFPYDFAFFATHCGDASGHRWTYEFQDSEDHQRRLVVDIALGVGRTDDPEMLKVQQFIRFHSLDGVDWNDPDKEAKVYVGKAILDWSTQFRADKLEPTKKELVDRVSGSAVLRMHDNNYVVLPQYLAGKGSPIIMTNACASWHELAIRLMFENARAYIGTLFPVVTSEAHAVAISFLDTYYGKPLPEALWLAQNSVYQGGIRRPYVVSGVYPQTLRVTPEAKLERIARVLSDEQREWERLTAQYETEDNPYRTKKAKETVEYYRGEAAAARFILASKGVGGKD